MKREYIEPQAEVVLIEIEQNILGGSATGTIDGGYKDQPNIF